MIQVGDDGLAIGEDDFGAGPVEHDPGGCDDRRRPSRLVKDFLADSEVSHRPPAAGRGNRRINGEGLPLQAACYVVGKRDHLVGRRQHELAGMQNERFFAVGLDEPGQVGLFHRGVDVRVLVVLEDPEVPVHPDVDAGRLDQLR